MLFAERSLFVFLQCVSTSVGSTAEASMIIFFSCNQCFTKHRGFSFFLLKQLVTWQPLFALWTVKWGADCCGRQARWMSRYGRIHVATQRYLNGRIFSDLVGQPTVLHLNTIHFKRLALVDMAPFLCMKPADKTELPWHLLETWPIISCGELFFFPHCHFKRQTLPSTSEPRNKHLRDGWFKARSKGKLMLSAWLDTTQGKCRRCFKHSCTEEEGSNFPLNLFSSHLLFCLRAPSSTSCKSVVGSGRERERTKTKLAWKE